MLKLSWCSLARSRPPAVPISSEIVNFTAKLDWRRPNSPSFREFSEWNDIQDLRCCHWHWAILTINHFLFQIQMMCVFDVFKGFVHFGLNSQGFYECRGIVVLHLLLMYISMMNRRWGEEKLIVCNHARFATKSRPISFGTRYAGSLNFIIYTNK